MKTMPRAFRTATFAMILGGAAGPAVAAPEALPERPVGAPGSAGAAAGGVRPVAAILADVVKAMGGPEPWKQHTTMREKIELTISGLGISGTGERFATADDKMLLVTTLPGIGTTRQGSNGKVLWSEDPINGTRVLTGAEGESARVESVWAPELRFAELFKSITATSEKSSVGSPLECLVLAPKEGQPLTNCYDARTHLQVSQKGIHATPQGDTPFTSQVKDYRDVGGIKMPFAVDTQTGPISFTLKVTEIRLDEPMDAKMFEPPAGAGKGKPAKKAPAKKAPTKKAPAKPKSPTK